MYAPICVCPKAGYQPHADRTHPPEGTVLCRKITRKEGCQTTYGRTDQKIRIPEEDPHSSSGTGSRRRIDSVFCGGIPNHGGNGDRK